jgi:hypothetical protein
VTTAWKPAKLPLDHTQVSGTCVSCHNGTIATGKSATHIGSTTSCQLCHITSAWKPAILPLDHTQVLNLSACSACHNGTKATGKQTGHVQTTLECGSCHKATASWTVVVFDHTGVAAGTCSSCHNGVKATGKSTSHLPTTQSCDACHSTTAWKPAVFNHSGITSGCASCHNGSTSYGGAVIGFKSASHWATGRECSYCHAYPNWTPLTFVTTRGGQGSHLSAAYPGDHTGVNPTCVACHTTRADTVVYRNATYAGSCAGCHSSKYTPDPHTKFGNTKYTVSELRNCSGACHVYTNSTLTTIQSRRAGPQHRVTARSFD